MSGQPRGGGSKKGGTIKVGTASWTDKTLIASGWYPADVTTPEERLRFYAKQFGVVEVDSTYYTPPNERNSVAWAERTPDDFVFNIKEGVTKNLYLKDVPAKTVEEVWERFLSALEPLHTAGKLGAVLFQFPQWFPIGRANKQYILECADRAKPYRICVEFRNKTWLSESNREETLDFLRSYALPYVCVDMPQGYPSSVPPVVAATADLAVVRFHGHSDKWNSRDIYERFGYKYTKKELVGWVPKLAELSGQADRTYVLMNNCRDDYAQTNAQQLADLLAAELG
jgi:uncharacterized protein YecE (DUF72 family)